MDAFQGYPIRDKSILSQARMVKPLLVTRFGRVFRGITSIAFVIGCSVTTRAPRSPHVTKISPVDSADWTNRDSSLRFERLLLPSAVKSLVIVYGSLAAGAGVTTGDTVTYSVPASGVVFTSRRVPVPWVKTHLFRTDSAGRYREVLVATNCDLHRVATRAYPGQIFGCWMPVVLRPAALRPYVAATISDSAGLEAAYDSTMMLMNREVFGNRMHPAPTWSEPIKPPPVLARALADCDATSRMPHQCETRLVANRLLTYSELIPSYPELRWRLVRSSQLVRNSDLVRSSE